MELPRKARTQVMSTVFYITWIFIYFELFSLSQRAFLPMINTPGSVLL